MPTHPSPERRPTLSHVISQALQLERTGQRRAAIALLQAASLQQPRSALLWFHLGALLDAGGKMRQAIPCYLRALRLNPRHPHRYEMCLYLCSSYRKAGRPQAAHRWLKKAEAFGRDTALQRRLKRLLNRKANAKSQIRKSSSISRSRRKLAAKL
jgi:tetratricopeptide (TPR) repeat protein